MKKLVRPRRWSFIIFLFNPNFLFAQAPNNVCASTEALVYSGTAYVPATGNVANATIDGTVNTCNGTERYDVWYSFVAKSVYPTITLTNVGANFTNPGLQILYGGCNGASISCGTTSVKPTTLTVGLIYHIRVFSTSTTTPTASAGFTISVIDPPANDACANATLLTTASCNNGTIAASTADVGTACGNTVKYDVWYKFTATSTNPTISLKTLGSNFHSTTDNNVKARLQLFAACGGTSITCGGTSLTASTLTVGTTYYIRVYSITSNAIPTINGDFTICLTDPAPLLSSRMNEVFQQTTLSGTNLIDNPWEVIYGPDDSLWITEAAGYRVYKMDPSNGGRVTILELFDGASGYLTSAEHAAFNRGPMSIPQGGLAGMALHPDWASKKYVYLSYVHSYNSTAANSFGVFYTNSIVRFTYNPATRKLEGPVIICNTLPGSSDHNSQRMIIAPVGGTHYLFYAAGDMGSGQFGNAQRPINAQTINIYEGKILRFNLEPELAAPANDQWIPTDNPFNSSPVAPSARNAVWSLGIRNNQGFAFADGKLFGSSHGPYSDDEINVIDKEKNYGHPKVIGYAFDGNYNGSKAGHRNGNGTTDHPTSMPLITNEAADSVAILNYKTPMYSAYPSTQAVINDIWTKENDGIASTGIGNGSWPSEGWSGMDAYTHSLIPGWKNSLVLGSLKWGRMLRFKIDAATETVLPIGGFDTLSYFGSTNRFRDMAISPNGKDIFLVMDKSETTSGPSAANPRVSACNGCVQKYTFLGYNDAAGESSIPASIPVTGGATNSCRNGTSITIEANNNNLWVPITGPDGNIIAEIDANNQNLGAVQSSFYTHSGAVRTTGGRHFLNRNIFLSAATAPSSNVNIRLYITSAEFDALIASGGATTIGSLRILQNTDACKSFPTGVATLITPTIAKLHGTDAYVLQASLPLGNASSFYFANGNYTLPLELVTFSGSLHNNTTLLKWITENELNTSHFIVERSIDGVTYNGIGSVKAAHNSNGKANYHLSDKDVLTLNANIIYYRLKLIDGDAAYRYSNVITISFQDRNTIVSVSPNPVSNTAQVRISPKVDGKVQWKLTDNLGRTIRASYLNVQKDNPALFYIEMEGLSQGLYYVQVSGSGINKKIKVQKL